jgi:hypothetical protein
LPASTCKKLKIESSHDQYHHILTSEMHAKRQNAAQQCKTVCSMLGGGDRARFAGCMASSAESNHTFRSKTSASASEPGTRPYFIAAHTVTGREATLAADTLAEAFQIASNLGHTQ